MEIVMKNGITITIDDDEIVSWDHDLKLNFYTVWLKDGSRWDYWPSKGVFIRGNK